MTLRSLTSTSPGCEQHGYIVAHVSNFLTSADVCRIQKRFLGQATCRRPDLAVSSSEWVRLRAGLASVVELDDLYGVTPQNASISNSFGWATMFKDAGSLGMGPAEIIQAIRESR